MEKFCSRCKLPKNLEQEFNKKTNAKDGRQPYCRLCSSISWKEYFPDHRRMERNREYRETIKNAIQSYLNKRNCVNCGKDTELHIYPLKLLSDAISRKYSLKRMFDVVESGTVLCQDCAKYG